MKDILKFVEMQLPGFSIGVVSAILIAFGSGFVKEYFKKRELNYKEKRKLAKDILHIINQGEQVSYRETPRHKADWLLGADQLEALGENIAGQNLRGYINFWEYNALHPHITTILHRGSRTDINKLPDGLEGCMRIIKAEANRLLS